MVRSGTERLLSTDRESAGVHQVSEELPSSGDLEDLESLLLGDQVNGARGGHGPGETLDARLEVGDGLLGPVGNDGDRVGGSDERVLSVDHVSVSITVRGSSKLDVLLVDSLDEVVGVGQVGVRMRTAKVGERHAVLDRRLVESEGLDKDGSTVRASDTVQGVEQDGRLGGSVVEPVLDHVKVKDRLEELEVVGDGVHDGDLEGAVLKLANLGQVELGSLGYVSCDNCATHVGKVDRLVLLDVLGDLVDAVGDVLGSGTTIGSVKLDTKVVVGSTGVVRGGEQDTSVGLERSDQGGDGGGGEDRVLAEDNVLDTVGSGDLEDDLRSLGRLHSQQWEG